MQVAHAEGALMARSHKRDGMLAIADANAG